MPGKPGPNEVRHPIIKISCTAPLRSSLRMQVCSVCVSPACETCERAQTAPPICDLDHLVSCDDQCCVSDAVMCRIRTACALPGCVAPQLTLFRLSCFVRLASWHSEGGVAIYPRRCFLLPSP